MRLMIRMPMICTGSRIAHCTMRVESRTIKPRPYRIEIHSEFSRSPRISWLIATAMIVRTTVLFL